MSVVIKKTGFNLTALSLRTRTNIAGVLNGGAQTCVSLAKQLAAVDTGFMRDNIAQTEEATPDHLKVTMASQADYSAFVEYGCFTRKSFKILTKRGYVPFSEVREGEEVLTHLNRWRRVEKKHEFNSKTVIPTITIQTKRGSSVTVTKNHKFFTNAGFVEASHLNVGDEIKSIHNDLPHFHWKNFMEVAPWQFVRRAPTEIIVCKSCGGEFPELVSYTAQQGHPRKYCSPACVTQSRVGNQYAKGKTWKLTDKQKERFQGENNPMFQQERAHYYSEIGYREDLGHKVKSTWEANYARILKASGIPYEYEPVTFRLKSGSYTPDFLVYDPVKGEHFVEVKGYMTEKSENKIREFRVRYPDRRLAVIGEAEYTALATHWKDKVFWESKVSRRGSSIKFVWDSITSIARHYDEREGYCNCGCGELAPLALRNENRRGHRRGQPMPFVHGHNGRSVRTCYDLTVEEDHSYTLQHLVCHNTVKMEAQPFMAPAFESARKQVNNNLLRVLR